MIADFSVAKQPGQQGQGMLGKGRVNEGLLSFQGFNRATARFSVVVEIQVHDLGKELRRRPQAEFCLAIPLVQWLTKDELPAICIVAQIKPVRNSAAVANRIANRSPCSPRIHAPDHNMSAEIIT
jgi:hypothetical protein